MSEPEQVETAPPTEIVEEPLPLPVVAETAAVVEQKPPSNDEPETASKKEEKTEGNNTETPAAAKAKIVSDASALPASSDPQEILRQVCFLLRW